MISDASSPVNGSTKISSYFDTSRVAESTYTATCCVSAMTNVNTSCGLPSNVSCPSERSELARSSAWRSSRLRQAAVVLDELLLARLRDRDRRDGVRAVVVVRALPGLDDDDVVTREAGAAGPLFEAQAIVLQVQQQRLLLRAGFERRRGRRHLQPRICLAGELHAHDVDRSQRLGAADRSHCAIEHGACRCLRALGQCFGIVRLGVHGARREQQ